MTLEQLIQLAVQHHNSGQLARAEQLYRQVLLQRPEDPLTLNCLALAMQAQNRYLEAVDLYGRFLARAKGNADIYNNLGHCLDCTGRGTLAVEAYRKALELDGQAPLPLYNMGHLLAQQGNHAEAIDWYKKAIESRPEFPEAWNAMATALRGQGKYDEAISAFHKAIELRPDYASAMNNLAVALASTGRLDQSLELFAKVQSINPLDPALHSNFIYTLNFLGDSERIRAEQAQFEHRHGQPWAGMSAARAEPRDENRKLRVGWISADFRQHAVGWCLMPIFEHRDRNKFEYFCYPNSSQSDDLTQKLKEASDHWQVIAGMSDTQAVERIAADQLDLLIDLSMHSSGNRLAVLARKPAAVQATYLAYPGGTGLSAIDYRISDPFIDSDETNKDYAEKTISLPKTYWCYRPPFEAPEVGPPPFRKNGYVMFGCLNNFAKVSIDAQKVWSEILGQIKDSRLLIFSPAGSHRKELADRFAGWGVDAERIEFVEKSPWPEHVGHYGSMDIALDPFPCGGGLSTCDALYMGVPVVSLSGRLAVGRAGKSILNNAGHPELVAESVESYVQIATTLARSPDRLEEMRKTLRNAMKSSSLMDEAGFTQDLELILGKLSRK